MSLSCIVQIMWDLCEYNSTFICHLDKNGCKVEQKDVLKVIKAVGMLMA